MSEASVTLKLKPSEFKLITDALEIARLESETVVKNESILAAHRAQSRAEMARFADLLARLTA